jgi:hypothetical protein
MRTVIYIDKNGDVSGLADDVVDKLDLGVKSVNRVSNVEFDHSSQQWVATALDGEVIAQDAVRSRVIDMERNHLNSLIEKSFS